MTDEAAAANIFELGAPAFQEVLDNAMAFADFVWMRAIQQGGDLSDPSRRAAVEARVMADCAKISDRTVRRHYEAFMREKIQKHFGVLPQRHPEPPTRYRRQSKGSAPISPALAHSKLVRAGAKVVSLGPLLRSAPALIPPQAEGK